MNLIKNRFIYRLLRGRAFILLLRLPFVFAFVFIIFSGLFGSVYRNADNFIVGPAWLLFITLAALLAGKIWCLVCPWNALAEWIQVFFRIPNAKFRVPGIFRNFWAPFVLLIILIWLEYSIELTDQPRLIAYLALAVFGITFISLILFPRKSFCRYGCPVGAICGIYGLFATLELRSADKEVCNQCLTKDCIKGNENGEPCPVFEYPGKIDTNLYCILCTECVRTCPNENIAFNLRLPAQELIKRKSLSASESFLVLTMLALSVFGALNISAAHFSVISWTSARLGISEPMTHILTMASLICAFGIILLVFSFILRTNIAGFIGVFLPITLFNHLANTVKLFSIRAEEAIPLISDPIGRSWNLFGTAGHLPQALFTPDILIFITGPLMLIGFAYSAYLAYRLVKINSQPKISFILVLVPMGLLVWVNWWLMPQ
jgi:polyferredoxin